MKKGKKILFSDEEIKFIIDHFNDTKNKKMEIVTKFNKTFLRLHNYQTFKRKYDEICNLKKFNKTVKKIHNANRNRYYKQKLQKLSNKNCFSVNYIVSKRTKQKPKKLVIKFKKISRTIKKPLKKKIKLKNGYCIKSVKFLRTNKNESKFHYFQHNLNALAEKFYKNEIKKVSNIYF